MNKKRRRIDYSNVRTLPLTAVIEEWCKEIDIHPDALEHELRLALFNIERDWRSGDLIDPMTPNERLPGPKTLVGRDWIEMFCGKQGWPWPDFWFRAGPEEIGPPGRPSIKSAIVQEFRNRFERGETCPTISEEARAIAAVMLALGHVKGAEPKTVEGHIREPYDAWKAR